MDSIKDTNRSKIIGNNKAKREGLSTRTMILEMANKMISESGMADFRIDNLSKSLSLSPGNITYHFPKKEDISNALWSDVTDSMPVIYTNYFTSILDIKQLFLLLRSLFIENYKYRGVICYKIGDISVLKRTVSDKVIYKNLSLSFYDLFEMLNKNGYVRDADRASIAKEHDLIIGTFMWLFGEETVTNNLNDINIMAYHYSVAVIYPLINLMTDKGLTQFSDILNIK